MKILITSDLHGDTGKFTEIASAADNVDLTLVAGDVINEKDDSLADRDKKQAFVDFVKDMEIRGNRLVFTSGNHDLDDLFGSEFLWMHRLANASSDLITGYQCIRTVDDVVVLSLRWIPWNGDFERLREENLSLALVARAETSSSGKLLIILNHESPLATPVAEEVAKAAAPDFWVCGHKHSEPFEKGPITTQLDVACLNTGVHDSEPSPCFGILDTTHGQFDWFCGPRLLGVFPVMVPSI